MYRLSIDFSEKRETSLLVSFFIAVALHAAWFALSSHMGDFHPPIKPKAKVVVQTVALAPKNNESVATDPKETSLSPVIALTEEKEIKKEGDNASFVEEKMAQEEMPPLPKPLLHEEPKEVKNDPPPPVKKKSEPQKKNEEVKKALPVKKEAPSSTSKPKPRVEPKANLPKKPDVKKNEEVKPLENLKEIEKTKKIEETKRAEEAKAALEKKKNEEKAALEKKRNEERVAAEKKKAEELKAALDKENAILAKAKESFAKVGETRGKIANVAKSATNIAAAESPQIMGSLQVEALAFLANGGTASLNTKEIRYSDEVAYRLKSMLRLPEYGAVKIKLTLERSGKVARLEVVNSESQKNKSYVEEKVKNILFSSFGKEFQGAAQMTFVITLQND